jgi:hypothetical protein
MGSFGMVIWTVNRFMNIVVYTMRISKVDARIIIGYGCWWAYSPVFTVTRGFGSHTDILEESPSIRVVQSS